MIVFTLLLILHVLASLLLITIVLVQGGRGGLGEALGGAAAQTLFGGGTNIVMAKVTTMIALVFAVTCLSLAALSSARGRSVIEQVPEFGAEALPLLPGVSAPIDQAPGQAVRAPDTTDGTASNDQAEDTVPPMAPAAPSSSDVPTPSH